MRLSTWLASISVFFVGCSTHPVADFMDHFFPAKIDPNAAGGRNRGGVCDPPVGSPVAPNSGRTPATAIPPGVVPSIPGPPPGTSTGLPPVEPPPAVPPSIRN
jgi:hypothetical protein